MLVVVVMGMVEASRVYEMQNLISVAAREGARYGCMDRSGMNTGGQSTNAKIATDVRNYLRAAGLNPDNIEVAITSGYEPYTDFDLDDPDNDLKYFRVEVSIPYYDTCVYPPPGTEELKFRSSVVFRNSRASLVQ